VSAVIKLSSPATREYWEIPILHEDEHLAGVDKPSGLLTSPDRYDPSRPSLMQLAHEGIAAGKPWAAHRRLTYLMNAHRLDAEVSGVLLLAKSKPVLVALANVFGTEAPRRRHLALVQGEPSESEFELDAKLAPHPARPGAMHVDARRGKKSRTLCRVLERFAGWTLLECDSVTGRSHQIRVHLSHARLPVVGDGLYGGKPLWLSRLKRGFRLKEGREERPLIGRVALHAAELSLAHPVTSVELSIKSPWPKDLTVAVKYLRRYGLG
jgi:RluA family pseudouridine synthase